MRSTRWQKLVEREGDFWKNWMMISSVGDVARVFGCSINERLTTRRGMVFTHWLNLNSERRTLRELMRRVRRDPVFPGRVAARLERAWSHLQRMNGRLMQRDFSRLSDRQLAAIFTAFCRAYRSLYAPLHLAVSAEGLEENLRKWFSQRWKRVGSDSATGWAQLFASPRVNLLQLEELALLELALKVKRKKFSAARLRIRFAAHVQQYAGLPVIHDGVRPWSSSYFHARFRQYLRQPNADLVQRRKNLLVQPALAAEQRSVLLARLGAPPHVAAQWRLVAAAAWVRLTVRAAFALTHHASRSLFAEISRRCNSTPADLKWLTDSEIRRLLRNRIAPEQQILQARQQASVLRYRRDHVTLLTGERAERFIVRELPRSIVGKAVATLRGQTAYPGRVVGIARVVLDQNDAHKLKPRDVLVTRMTTMELMPAVSRAAAVVTDEGGITCHAAIIARERRLPCIIGTKIATQVLQDGDRILVDATRGIILKDGEE